jgi:tetratricopeptide (TPR) repeat protein
VTLEQAGTEQGQEALVLAGLVEQCQLRATPNALFDAGEAERLAGQALALAERLHDKAAEARIRWGLLNAGRFSIGQQEQARQHGEQALTLARELGLRELESYILNDIADLYMMDGLVQRGRQSLSEASLLFRELGNLPMLADNLSSMSGYEFFVGRDDQAIALSDEAYAISQSIGNVWGQAYSRLLIGYVYWDRGEAQRAIDVTGTAIRQAHEVGFAGAAISSALLGLVYADLGAYEAGRRVIEQGWQVLRGAMSGFESALWAAQAQLSIEQGELAQAEESTTTLDRAEQTLNPFMVIFHRSTSTRLALAQGRFDTALARAERDLAALASLEIERTRAEILLLKAQALSGLGRWAEARSVLREGIALAEQGRYRRLLWRLQSALAQVEMASGRPSEAAPLLAQAQAQIEFIAGNLTDPDLAASFRSRPDVQAVLQA